MPESIETLEKNLNNAMENAAQARADINVWRRNSPIKDQEIFRVYDDRVRQTERWMRAAMSALVSEMSRQMLVKALAARRSA